MTGVPQAQRAVIVHGPADQTTTTALTDAGLEVVIQIGDTSVWAPASWRPPALTREEGATKRPDRLLLTISEAAQLLGVGRTTAYELINSGRLEVVHVGRAARIPVAAVEELVDRLRDAATMSHRDRILDDVGAEPTTSQPSAAVESSAC